MRKTPIAQWFRFRMGKDRDSRCTSMGQLQGRRLGHWPEWLTTWNPQRLIKNNFASPIWPNTLARTARKMAVRSVGPWTPKYRASTAESCRAAREGWGRSTTGLKDSTKTAARRLGLTMVFCGAKLIAERSAGWAAEVGVTGQSCNLAERSAAGQPTARVQNPLLAATGGVSPGGADAQEAAEAVRAKLPCRHRRRVRWRPEEPGPRWTFFRLRCRPVRPAWKPLYADHAIRIESWSKFVSEAYWNVALQE